MEVDLSLAYRSSFPAMVRAIGARLSAAGAVDLGDVTEFLVEAKVDANGLVYRVGMRHYLRPAVAAFQCSCRPMAGDAKCPHVWAVLLELQELLQDLEQTVAQFSLDQPVPKARASRPPQAKAAPSWRQRLAAVLPPPRESESVPPTIEYYVELGGPGVDAALTIQIRERTPKKNGELSVPRASRLPAESVALLARHDRELLELRKRDGRRDYGYWSTYRGDSVALASPWTVSVATMPLVLPLLKASRRVFLAPVPTAKQTPVPLTIDTEPPFGFEIVLPDAGTLAGTPPATKQPSSEVVSVQGVLRRGEQVLQVAGARPGDTEYLVVERRLVRIECHGASSLAAELVGRGPLEVPRDEVPQLLTTLARVRGAPHFLRAVVEQLPASVPLAIVALTFPRASDAPLRAGLTFDYDGILVTEVEELQMLATDDALLRRDRGAERRLREQVLALGLSSAGGDEMICARAELATVVAALSAAGFRVIAEGKKLRPLLNGKGSVRTGIDWFEVEGVFHFDGHMAQLPELLRRKTTPEGFVELDDGSFGLLPQSWLRQVEALRLLGGEVDGELVRLSNSQALLLDAALAAREQSDFVVDRKFAELRQRVGAFREVVPIDEPEAFQGQLRPYQRQGLGWLAFLQQFGLGGCLADDMGLGKTVQVLAHLLSQPRGRGRNRRPSLLVAPRSVLGNWLAEARRFAPDLKVVDFSAPDRWHGSLPKDLRRADLVLTTYALVRADAIPFDEQEITFDYVVLDEAQAIKNAESLSSKAVRLLRAKHRLVLTGTPVENHLGDLWSLFEFLNPGMLGRLAAFRAMFNKDASAEAMVRSRELVQRALRPVMLRRTKSQVLKDLPEKVEQTLWCELEPEQRRRYDALKKHYQQRLLAGPDDLDETQGFVVLEALLRLRQAACHEGLLDAKGRASPSAKFEELLPRLEDLTAEGHKALVFSQFTSMLDLLEPELRRRGIGFERLDGKTRKRTERIERFQTDAECRVFLISLKAGGFGLNLTAASYVFLLDPWWNPASEMQAIDRAHRIGQKRTVHAYRLVCRDTVEERVIELQTRKKALSEAILGNERSLLQDMTRADLELLLG